MPRLLALLPLLAACGEDIAPGDKPAEELAELGEPYAGIVATTAPGYLRSECSLGVELFEAGSAVAVDSVSINAQGGEWAGFVIAPETPYTAEAAWDTCTTVASTGTGTFASNTFSGAAGDWFLFRYNGESGSFDSLTQRYDYEGGVALVTFVDTATSADVEALADSLGVSAEIVATDSKQYEITWRNATPVGAVLASFAESELYLDGEPVWIRIPDWW